MKNYKFLKKLLVLALVLIASSPQMWAYDFYKNVYFDNSTKGWSEVSLVIGTDGGSQAYHFTKLNNCNLWYKWMNWSGYNDMYFINADWKDENWWSGYDYRPYGRVSGVAAADKWGPYKDNYNGGGRVYFDGVNNSSAAGGLPLYTATLKVKKSTDGGDYTEITSGSWPATINLKGTTMNGDAATQQSNFNTSSGASATYDNIPVSGEVTMTLGASADSKYEFVGWGTGSSASTATTPYTYNITGATTYYAFFRTKQYTIAYSGGTNAESGSHASDTKYYGTDLTLPDAVFTRAGYAQTGWATSDGGAQSYALGGTYTANSAVTLYPVWTAETTHDVTVYYKCGGTAIGDESATESGVGVTTTRSVTAPTIYGYTFSSWTLGNGIVNRTAGSSTTTNPIVINTNATDDYVLTANYTEDLSSPYIVSGGDKIVTTGTAWRTTADANNKMNKKTGYSSTYDTYFYVNVTATNTGSSNSNYQFKIYNTSTSTHYGLTASGQYYLTRAQDHATARTLSTSGANIELRADALGEYELKVNYSSDPTITVTFPTAYTVTYGYGTGGSSVTATYSSTSFSSGTKVQSGKTVRFTQTAATGYTFKEWNTQSDGNGTRLSTVATYDHTVASTNNVYAIYTPNDYVVTLNANTGSANRSVTVTYNSSATKSFTAVTKTGYTCTGYWTNTSGGYKVVNADGTLVGYDATIATYLNSDGTWKKTSSTTLYAQWQANTYDVTLDDNGGTEDGSATATYDATSLSSIEAPTKAGYHPEGYYTNAGCSIKVATDAGVLQASVTGFTNASSHWTLDDDATLHTKWTANTYYVRFNKNDGSATGTMSNESFTYDASAKALTANAFEKTGYDFAGWATSAGGSVVYDDEEKVSNLTDTKNGIVDLYAKWTAHKYTITLDGQDATSLYHKTSVTVDYNNTYINDLYPEPESTDLPWKTAYRFQGWYTGVGGTGLQIMDGYGALQSSKEGYTDGTGKWIKADDITLYAKWMQSSAYGYLDFYVNNNGGSGGEVVAIYNSSSLESFTASTRSGYNFQGFFTASEDGDQVIDKDGNIVAGNVTGFVTSGKWSNSVSSANIYAHWTPITYTVSFAHNDDASYVGEEDGTAPDDIEVNYEGDVTMPAAGDAKIFTRDGYSLIGWSIEDKKAKGSNSATLISDYNYAAGSNYHGLTTEDGATVTLYPKWLGNIYTVSFNARGGTGLYPTSINVRYGETYGSGNYGSLPAPTAPTGKAFVGWYTSAVGGTLVEAEMQLTTIGAHTLYAHYEDKAIVYFKNTIGWENVFVTYAAYWDTYNNPSKGTGNNGLTYHKMSLVPGTTDIYQDEIPSAILANWTAGDNSKIAFNSEELLTDEDKHAPTTGDYNNYNKGEVVYRMDFDSRATMFVPKDDNTNNTDGNYKLNGDAQYISTGYKEGTSSDPEYTSGYWIKYNDTYSGYLFSYQKNSGSWSAEYGMNASKKGDTIYVYSVKMDANTRYDLRIRKDCQTTNTKSRQFRYGTQITSAACTDLKLVCDPNNNSWMQTTVAGEYKFILTTKKDGHMYLTVEYPFAVGDYKLVSGWTDGSAKTFDSEYIRAKASTVDTVSVFVHYGKSPSLIIQKCTGINGSGVATWANLETGASIDLTDVDASGVYNFEITQPESGDPTGAFAGKYEGDYYIRTQGSDGGWDQYKDREDNVMTYSAYSMTQTLSDPYSHYYCRFIGSTSTDITYAIATKYSPNISGTMVGDATIGGNAVTTLPAPANVRFSWNAETNAMRRAYIKPAQSGDYDNSRFLVMHGANDDMIYNPDGSDITGVDPLEDNELQFDDMGDWIYQVMLQAKPGAQVSIIANYNGDDRYLVGGASSYETIMSGDGDTKYDIRAIYDFKTNRLMNAWTPSGDITNELSDIDMLWIRYKQNTARQITFNGGSLTNVKVVGAIELRYNDLVGHVASWTLETRPLLRYFISFPFDVNVSDIFGLHGAELGRDYVIRKYDGAERAKNGLFLGDGDTYWVDLTMDSVMHANEGYSLVFDNEYLNGDLGTIWTNKTGGSSVYLYFPAAEEIDEISNENAGTTLDQHLCKDARTYIYGGVSISHANSDSHWNLIGSPLFHNSYVYGSEGTNGQAGDAASETLDSYYAYDAEYNRWNLALYYNESTGEYYQCKAMHAMLVQFAGSVTWSIGAPDAPGIAARERNEHTATNRLITLNLLQNNEIGDYTYIKMDENGYSDFMLCEDLSKIIYKNKPMIFSYAGQNCVAYNKVAIESQTINLGVEIRQNDTYTFTMPENVAGQVTLVDHFAQTRTNLNIEDYEVYLNKGNYYDRFAIEIKVNEAPTAIDGVQDGSGSLKDGKAHKFIMDDQMYILMDGEIYDARGNRVK